MNSRQFFVAVACAAGLATAADASALTININGPGTANLGDTVKLTFDFSGASGPGQVVVFHDIFVAFDDAVLQYRGVDFSFAGIVSPAGQGDDFFQNVEVGAPDGNYKNPPGNQPPDDPWTYAGEDYGNGSLRIYQYSDYAGPPYDGLYNGESGWSGQSSGFTAFAVNFEVIALSAVTTAVALIDDTSYTEHWSTGRNIYDYKMGDQSTSWYPSDQNPPTVVIHELEVPVPAPLVLIGLGLGLVGLARRHRPSV